MPVTAGRAWFGTGRPRDLYEYFERAAAAWPNEVAIDVPPASARPRKTVTYAELRRTSERWARAVQTVPGTGSVAAILLRRDSEHLYAAQLGVLRSASTYVCVDPSFPDDQVGHILGDSGARALLTDTEGAERAARIRYAGPIILADGLLAVSTAGLPAPAPDSVAYLAYTSGSTGGPKAVLVPRRGVVNLVEGDLAEFGLGPGDRVAQGSSAAYDSSVEEVWLALASGATVVVLDDDTARLGPDLVPWLRRERVTVMCPPPTLLRTTGCENPREELPGLRLLYVGGEALPDDIAQRWSAGRRMVNGYGPTECTVTCLRQDIVAGRPVAIGRPVPGMRAWVLDENLRPVPPGGQGELCLGGAGVALGYLNRPELTAEKFPLHPGFGRIYRTGDLVHAEPDGTCCFHGRIDAQAKLRGYRIELEAIESCLARCSGVREAACRVQGQTLAAHVVPEHPESPPPVAELRKRLLQTLPGHMVPAVFGITRELPRTVGGKLRRADLPTLTIEQQCGLTARSPMERTIAAAAQTALSLAGEPAVDRDFFTDLGGSSLTAAMVVTMLRADPATAGITVRDLYQARTIAELARLAEGVTRTDPDPDEPACGAPPGNAIGATAVQSLWLALELFAGSVAAYFVFFHLLTWVAGHLGLIPLIFLAPVALTVGWTLLSPLSIVIAVHAKKALIGRYVPTRASVWSGFGVRMWIVRQFMRLIPWRRVAGTEFHCMVLRSLGARIGRRVHLQHGVDLTRGGWDMLEIGDDVSIGQDASIRLVQLERRQLVLGPVTVAAGATLDVRAGVSPHTRVGRNAWLTALSSLPSGQAIPDGQRWDGVPARPAGRAPPPPAAVPGLPPIVHGLLLMLSRDLLQWVLALPSVLASVLIAYRFGLSYRSLLDALTHPLANLPLLLAIGGSGCLTLVITVGLEALACRFLGTISPSVIGRWSGAYVRVWLKARLVSSAGRWLSGGLFWPAWLRIAGMKVGRGCEISTIIDVVPELVRVGPDSFFADGIYLGGPRVHQGAVTLAPVVVGANTFLGNHAVLPAGGQVPGDVLIGISTVAGDPGIRPGTSWFGHPPFELPRREVITVDRSLTHSPPLPRVVARVLWEWLRFALPIVPMLAALGWAFGVQRLARALPAVPLVLLGVPVITLATGCALCLFVLALKWGLLGRVRPGIHPLWSCWCSRWDFLYVAWGFVAAPVLAALEGTLLLAVYLRRTGMKIGKRVVFGEGFAQVVDPDMLDIEDGATVSAMFQAHTFEDRVLKIDGIHVGADATLGSATVPLYGADIGERTEVAPHSVIMKREQLLPGRRYEGAPTRELPRQASQELRQPAAIA
ncbi:non-ribosomal peptide synthetase [Amycolatopsis taiwanensis]|uniref:Amino acid adenylation protein n=1 Tax=Amycolatopsis taiwanensis TaxID=342230 RepID=A0A9W6VGE9_9PSEU|nr:non-ribosomal peptide synthetase [Amycolatopsis taiwanensis]GLY66427.1 amino acid adenylation protein [Amycolatopsis taiwanensis]